MIKVQSVTQYGRGQPGLGWVAATGTIADLTTNTLASVATPATNVAAVWGAWSGVAWAPWWGKYGSMIASGGGHSDRQLNEIWRILVDSRLVSQIKPSATIYVKPADSYVADPTTGWLWANAIDGDTTLQVGEPFAAHFYSALMALPPGAIPGIGDSNGVLYTAGRISMGTPGQRGTMQAHYLRLGIDLKWTAHGSPGTDIPGYGGTAYDPVRKRVWYVNTNSVYDATHVSYRNLSDGSWGSIATTGANAWGAKYRVFDWHASAGLVMAARIAATMAVLGIFDPATNICYTPTIVGTGPADADGSWAWSDTWGAWAYMPAAGGSTVWFLKLSGDPRTGTWTWSNQVLTGPAAVAPASATPGYNRLRHASALGNILIWAADVNYPVQQLSVAAP